MLHTPELNIEKDEAQRMCDGMAELQKHLDIPMPDAKFVAIASMLAISASVYGPRIMAITNRKNREKQDRKNGQPNVTPINQPMAGSGIG